VLASKKGIAPLLKESAAKAFLSDAFAHLKIIGYSKDAAPLFTEANVPLDADEGLVAIDAKANNAARYLEAAKAHRIWTRERKVRDVP
jgi:catalase